MATATLFPRKVLRFRIDKDHLRKIEFRRGDDREPEVTIYHLYPTLDNWCGRETPDEVNPRSHEDEALVGGVPKAIESTLRNSPDDFFLANRGATILGDSLRFDKDAGNVEITLSDFAGDDPIHGIADGGTTDAIIARVQADVASKFGNITFQKLKASEIPAFLRRARIHLEVIIGLQDRDRIRSLVQGRNTSKQVSRWTIANFEGNFEWIKEILEKKNSPLRGRVAYEENAGAAVTILDVLAILTLFHQAYDTRGTAPTVAYSSKGRMDSRLTSKEFAKGYTALAPILLDILRLHDHVYLKFEDAFKEFCPNGKLGGRGPRDGRMFPREKHYLPITDVTANITIPSGALYPLLAAHRALVEYDSDAKARAAWSMNPFDFFDNHGATLVQDLFEQIETVGDNPQLLGKQKSVYNSLFKTAQVILR